MTTMESQITSLTVVYWTVYSDTSKKTSKFRVTGLCVRNWPGPVNSPHKGPGTRKLFPFDDVIMRRSHLSLWRHNLWLTNQVLKQNRLLSSLYDSQLHTSPFLSRSYAYLDVGPILDRYTKVGHAFSLTLWWWSLEGMSPFSWVSCSCKLFSSFFFVSFRCFVL